MMNLTPQSMRSPVSPYANRSKHSFSSQKSGYPTTPQPESMTLGQASHHGLGLFGCSSHITGTELPPSPQPSDSWSHSSMMDQDFTPTTQPPDIFSAAFDPFFSGFPSSSNTGMTSAHSPEAPGLDYCQSPPSSNLPSHRSSISSSYAGSEDFSHNHSGFTYTPRVKVEDTSEWFSSAGNAHVLQRTLSSQSLSSFSTNISNLDSPTEDLYKTRHADCSKTDSSTYMAELQATSDGRLPRFDAQTILPSVSRIKKKRQRTTPEEATHECRVCGKLFKRSYNWKSHMDTHNPERKYPHPCTAMIGNSPCTKKFQRKTDLDRHYDSVHLKARNHRCTLCGNRFARRDTLRRHTEDGCPKRLELAFREGSAAMPARWSFTNFPSQRSRSYSLGMPQPSPIGPPSSAPAPSSATFPMLNRPDYSGVGHAPPAYHS